MTTIIYRDGLGRPLTAAEVDGNFRSLAENKVEIVAGKVLSSNDYTTAEKNKLAAIATGATANQTDAYLLNRANHTGTQAIGTITDLQTVLDSKVDKVNGMGLSANSYTTAEKNKLADLNKLFLGVYVSLSALQAAWPTADPGQYAQVDPGVGTDIVNYNWDANDSKWVIGGSGGSGATNTDALPEGTTNLYFKTARVLASVLAGFAATAGVVTNADTILLAFGKLQKQITDLAAVVAGKEPAITAGAAGQFFANDKTWKVPAGSGTKQSSTSELFGSLAAETINGNVTIAAGEVVVRGKLNLNGTLQLDGILVIV